jgi:hypothetical protein
MQRTDWESGCGHGLLDANRRESGNFWGWVDGLLTNFAVYKDGASRKREECTATIFMNFQEDFFHQSRNQM